MRQGRLLKATQEGPSVQSRLRSSRRQEKAVARDLKGKTQAASGAKWYAKGDVLAPEHVVECKQTEKLSYSIKLAEFRKAKLEAIMANKRVVLAVDIQGEKLAVIPWDDYVYMTQKDEPCSPSRKKSKKP